MLNRSKVQALGAEHIFTKGLAVLPSCILTKRALRTSLISTAHADQAVCCRGPDWEPHPRIFLPENADLGKAGKLRAMGALVAAHGSDAIETEAHARQEAQRLHGSYISPYNDPEVSSRPSFILDLVWTTTSLLCQLLQI